MKVCPLSPFLVRLRSARLFQSVHSVRLRLRLSVRLRLRMHLVRLHSVLPEIRFRPQQRAAMR